MQYSYERTTQTLLPTNTKPICSRFGDNVWTSQPLARLSGPYKPSASRFPLPEGPPPGSTTVPKSLWATSTPRSPAWPFKSLGRVILHASIRLGLQTRCATQHDHRNLAFVNATPLNLRPWAQPQLLSPSMAPQMPRRSNPVVFVDRLVLRTTLTSTCWVACGLRPPSHASLPTRRPS